MAFGCPSVRFSLCDFAFPGKFRVFRDGLRVRRDYTVLSHFYIVVIARVAQLAERSIRNAEVVGSIPTEGFYVSTIKSSS